MTENNSPDTPQPTRPFIRAAQKYDVLREAEVATIAVPSTIKELFTMNLTASSEKGAPMDDVSKLIIDLVFKPDNGLKLRPQEIQLILAHIGEILKELEAEENLTAQQEDAPCK
ncbi:MAG: hypothetical protein WCD70_06140 [Alphaproteobacteria bacterium]